VNQHYPGQINVTFNWGCTIQSNSTVNFSIARQYASEADLVIMVMGLNDSVEAEGLDRTSLLLTGVQNQLIANVSQAAKNKNTVLVVMSGGCVDVSQWQGNPNIQAILWAGYAGMFGGQALADVLFGEFSPTGRTDQTWYKNPFVNEVLMTDMRMQPATDGTNPGRGYRYYSGSEVLYPFGYGLSYSTWYCSNFAVSNQMLSVLVRNTGIIYSSGGVVLVYWVPQTAGKNGVPRQRLVGFAAVPLLSPDSSINVSMEMFEQFYWSQEYRTLGSFVLGGICDERAP